MLTISVLGPVEARRDGRLLPIPAGKTSELLVRLALDAGVPVRADRLLDDLWGADAVRTSRNTLQSKIVKLRRALGDHGAIVSADGGYALAVDADVVDALTVLRNATTAAARFEAGDDSGACELCAATLPLFHGELLLGAGDCEWVVPHRARLEQAHMALVETSCAARLRLGEASEVIGPLEAAVASSPFQEGLWVLLITALYRSGRQADALAAHRRIRERLADELGLDPGPQLQQLEQMILVHDASLGATLLTPVEFEGSIAGNLPSMAAELVGRHAELAAVADLIASKRLVEVVGPGGIGKTAFAIALGRTLTPPGGVWLARLETAITADDVTDTVIAALDVTGGEAALRERLRNRETLLILDNCEHVVDAAADLAVRLLDAAPGLRILCTSQVPLGVDGETLVELDPLALDDAVELFAQRATSQRGGQSVIDGRDSIHELCRSLDGLPLAIELAAARTKTLSIDEITRRLDNRFSVLTDPTSRRPERRRALKATIQWSYDLLFPDDQRGLWALAAFAGGAPLLAVESVLETLDVPAPAAIDVVGRLASRSLVIVDDSTTSPSPRYRLLDSIRAFALGASLEAGLADATCAAHAAWYARAATASTAGVRSRDQAEHLAFARAERANIDVALAWCAVHEPLSGLGIVNGFGWAWVVLGDIRGAQRIMAALAAAGNDAPAGEQATALLLAGWLEASSGDLDRAGRHIERAVELAESIGDVDLRARGCYYLAYVVSHRGEWQQAMALTEESRALYATLDRPWDEAASWLFSARAAISAGDLEKSIAACDEVQRSLSTVDDPWLHVRADAMLGELARIDHRFDDAVRHIGRAAETSRRLGFLQTEAYQVASLGRAQCQAGDYAAGCATLQVAVDKAEATGDTRMAALARVHLGRVLRAVGDEDRARAALEAAGAWHRSVGGGEQAALGDCLLAAMDAAHAVPGALDRLHDLLETARAGDEAHVEVFALDALARAAIERGDTDTAHRLIDAADHRMRAASHFITELDRIDKVVSSSIERSRSGSTTR